MMIITNEPLQLGMENLVRS